MATAMFGWPMATAREGQGLDLTGSRRCGMAKRFCHQCGELLGPNARFCPGCGEAVTETTESSPQQQPTMSSTAGPSPLPGVPSGPDPSQSTQQNPEEASTPPADDQEVPSSSVSGGGEAPAPLTNLGFLLIGASILVVVVAVAVVLILVIPAVCGSWIYLMDCLERYAIDLLPLGQVLVAGFQ